MTVFDVSCPPDEVVARCVDFWRAINVSGESRAIAEELANRSWSGTELTVVVKTTRMPDLVGIEAPGGSPDPFLVVALGGLAAYLTSHAVRAHFNRRHIIVAAHPTPDTKQSSTELWCIPWNIPIQRARPGKDPLAWLFDYLHASLYQQGITVGPPRLVAPADLPKDSILTPASLAATRGDTTAPFTSHFSRGGRS
ncbi:hypothetical protein ADJ76_06655 [Schaalia meyeri]|uniref:hypothetical protein n=1 Tax=Schaalia meyeri TaxID=52773 RepID=UPI000681D862|nr:hypothetical protein [Schaalia meyeri]AKU65464.1 hypothetical protein ADJ76_06655 [Schaalia meyeri]